MDSRTVRMIGYAKAVEESKKRAEAAERERDELHVQLESIQKHFANPNWDEGRCVLVSERIKELIDAARAKKL